MTDTSNLEAELLRATREIAVRLASLEEEVARMNGRIGRVRREAFERQHGSVGSLWRGLSDVRIDLERLRSRMPHESRPE